MERLKIRGSLLFLPLVIILMLSACTYRLADLTVISTRNVNLDKVDLDTLPKTSNIVGRDSKFSILFIPLGIPHLEDAVDDALQKGGGDILIDAVIYNEAWWFLIGQNTIKVKGDVIKTRDTQ